MNASLEEKYEHLCPLMNEVLRRRWAACEALALGRGGIALLATATGLSRNTIRKGIAELHERLPLVADAAESEQRIRRPGGGRHPLTQDDPALLSALQVLLEANTRGDPMSPLLWTCKSTRRLAAELTRQGHTVSH